MTIDQCSLTIERNVWVQRDQAKADELEERFIDFSVRIIRLSNQLPRTQAGRHIGKQLLRSGTSAAPNYGEARGAETNPDFAHKMGIVLKELNETSIWLRTLQKSEIIKAEKLDQLIDENQQLARIVTASIKTIRRKLNSKESKN